MIKAKYHGWEFKPALTAAIHKIAADFKLSRVTVTFRSDIPTAAIDRQGHIYITNIADDAVLTRSDLERYTGFALHELLHWHFTNFNAIDTKSVAYLLQLHNALEDAFIENLAVERKVTGNVEHLLAVLIDRMASEALDEVTDWSDPRQYPFALAVYARKHSTIKVPLAKGLKPLFDEACARLNNCHGTQDTWSLAEWLFAELCKIDTPEQPQQPEQPTKPSDQPDDGNPCDDGNPSDQEGGNKDGGEDGEGGDAPTKGDKPSTSPANDEGDTGVAKNPIKATKTRPNGTKVNIIVRPRSTEPTPPIAQDAVAGGTTGEWAVARDAYHVVAEKLWTINC